MHSATCREGEEEEEGAGEEEGVGAPDWSQRGATLLVDVLSEKKLTCRQAFRCIGETSLAGIHPGLCC